MTDIVSRKGDFLALVMKFSLQRAFGFSAGV